MVAERTRRAPPPLFSLGEPVSLRSCFFSELESLGAVGESAALSPSVETHSTTADVILSRLLLVHCRLSWETRLTRNARRDTAGQVTIKLFGVWGDFARDLGLTCESVRMPGASQGNPPESRADQG